VTLGIIGLVHIVISIVGTGLQQIKKKVFLNQDNKGSITYNKINILKQCNFCTSLNTSSIHTSPLPSGEKVLTWYI